MELRDQVLVQVVVHPIVMLLLASQNLLNNQRAEQRQILIPNKWS